MPFIRINGELVRCDGKKMYRGKKAMTKATHFHLPTLSDVAQYPIPKKTIAIYGKANSGKTTILNDLVGRMVLSPNEVIKVPILVANSLVDNVVLIETRSYGCSHSIETTDYQGIETVLRAVIHACNDIHNELITISIKYANEGIAEFCLLRLPSEYAEGNMPHIGSHDSSKDGYFGGIQCIKLSDKLKTETHRFNNPEHSCIAITEATRGQSVEYRENPMSTDDMLSTTFHASSRNIFFVDNDAKPIVHFLSNIAQTL